MTLKPIRQIVAVSATAMLFAANHTLALGENNPEARFSGGVRDGYDCALEIRSPTDREAFLALARARWSGASYDGYDTGRIIGATLPPAGTRLRFY